MQARLLVSCHDIINEPTAAAMAYGPEKRAIIVVERNV